MPPDSWPWLDRHRARPPARRRVLSPTRHKSLDAGKIRLLALEIAFHGGDDLGHVRRGRAGFCAGRPVEQYFTVQGIYRGWALLGFVLLGAIGANLVHAILIRDVPRAFWFALVAFLLMLVSLAIFFIWTYPANQATSNWTVAPANWASLRTQWEYSHAANAVITFLALCAVTASLVTKREP